MIDRLSRFRDGAGRIADNPLMLAGPVPGVVDLRKVGLMLAPPVTTGEFVPVSFWHGIELEPPEPITPRAHPDGLRAAFTEAVRDMTAGTDTIGVMVSGGLDSLAVLVHACDIAEGRRVIAFVIEMTDDLGGSSAAEVHRLIRAFDLDIELVVLDPHHDRAEPVWSPAGPHLHGLPEVNAAAAERAADLGVDLILSGDGSDELLGVPRYATAAIARRHGIPAAVRYAHDAASSGPGLFGEAAAVLSRLLPARTTASLYWAVNWPDDWCDPVAPAVLAEPYRTEATAWAKQWVSDHVVAHATTRRTWSVADAYDALFPHTALLPAGNIEEGSPFLHPSFLAAALALPLGDRYQAALPTRYWRCKAQVINLFPQNKVKALPRQKQYFSTALTDQAATLDTAKPLVAVEVGLIDPDQLRHETNTSVLLFVAAIERWLAGALRHGAQIG
ncbi:asparagine synthase-related protein [Streptomyces sp. NPDC052396]|uniref:asparagine synthase-related protein n=1 Tax=Streptomyces sp. NPDC052396 TaxID=3365689 RepID=UPI0037D13D65